MHKLHQSPHAGKTGKTRGGQVAGTMIPNGLAVGRMAMHHRGMLAYNGLMYSHRTLRLVVLLLLFGTSTSCTTPTPTEREPHPKHVLLITIDTLRADRLGSYGYTAARTPHLDAVAQRGLRFEQATTVMPLTLPAHASLMTSTYPAFHGIRDNGGYYLDDEIETLAERLSANGFRTGGFVSAFVLDSRWGIAQGFDHFFDDFDLTEFNDAPGMDAIQRPANEVIDRALAWLDPTDPSTRDSPFFAWVHLYDPHTPYDAPPEVRRQFPATGHGAYDAEIAYTDSQVGRLLQALDADGRLEDTLVVILADHGEMLGEHGEPTHGFFVYDGALRIPLLIAGPGIEPGVVGGQARIIDVLPTVLAQLAIEPPDATQGQDLMPRAGGGPGRRIALAESWFPRFHYGWSELTSIQDGRYKLIRAPRPELYDLQRDPRELDNLAGRDPQRAADMDAALEDLLAEISSDTPRAPAPVDDETANRLRALGYLGGTSSSGHIDDDRPRADPKDKIGLYTRIRQATAAAATDRLDKAVELVRAVIAEDAEVVEAHMLLGNFERQRDDLDAAIAAYRAALALDAEHQEALFSLGLAYKDAQRFDDALAGFERAAVLDPRNGKVLWQQADLHLRAGRPEDAEQLLLSALDLDLDRPRFLIKLGECYLDMGRPDDAETRLRQALAENDDLETAHYHLGLAHEARGRKQAAAEAYRRELALHDQAYRAAFNLAKLELAAGRPRVAMDLFEQTVTLQPSFGTGFLYLAKAKLDAGDLAGAESTARTGLDRQPEPEIAPLGHFILADVYSRQGRDEDAAREAEAGRRLQSAGRP